MTLLNEKIKSVSIKEFLIVIIFLYLIWYVINQFLFPISSSSVYVFIIFYFIFRLRNCLSEIRNDFLNIFSEISFKYVFLIVILNIFFSYGMLYLADFSLNNFPIVDYLVNMKIPLKSLLVGIGSILSIIVVSPISEELIFRGIFFNKLKIIVPATFAVVISSLLFGLFHSFGSMTSAFVFAICMVILYEKTENILVPIFAHFLNNVLAESVSHLDTGNVLFTSPLAFELMSILAIISSAIIFVLIFRQWNNFK